MRLAKVPQQRLDCAAVSPAGRMSGQRGASAVECLLALPVVLLLGLGTWQWALLMQARALIDAGVREAVRAGATGHAEVHAIETGLAKGLTPLWVDHALLGERAAATAVSMKQLQSAQDSGWLVWRQLSPTRATFADWGIAPSPAAPASGRVIPADNPTWRSRHMLPTSGRASALGEEPVGLASGQNFRQAGLLRLELMVGVPLHVPLAGRLFSWAARIAAGCESDTGKRIALMQWSGAGSGGALPPRTGHPDTGSGQVSCSLFGGSDASGRSLPRLPVRALAEARMQTDARITPRTPQHGPGASEAAVTASMSISAHERFAPLEAGSPGGDSMPTPTALDSASADAPTIEAGSSRQPGFLGIGAEREIWVPGACGIRPS